MKATYDKATDMLAISLTDGPIQDSAEMTVVVDFGPDNSIVGIEIEDASRKLDVEALLASNKIERKNITATHSQWDAIDRAARAAGMSRSAFLITAATEKSAEA